MAGKIAQSVISTGPKDELLTKDGRGATPGDTLSKTAAGLDDVLLDIIKDDRDDALSLDAVVDSLIQQALQPNASTAQADKAISSELGQNLTSIVGLDPSVSDDAKEAYIYKLSKIAFDNIDLKDGSGSLSMSPGSDTTKARALALAISKAAKDTSLAGYSDSRAEESILMSLMKQALLIGIPALVIYLINRSKRKREMRRQMIESVREVILRGDLDTLEEIIKHIGPEGVLHRVPDAVPLLLQSYRFPRGTTPDRYRPIRVQLLRVCDAIDVNWYRINRNGQWIGNLHPYSVASRDSKLLLLLPDNGMNDWDSVTSTHFVGTMIAPDYRQMTFESEIRRMYPRMIWRRPRR